MTIQIDLEVHIYAEGERCDQLLDDNFDSSGVFSDRAIKILRKNKKKTIPFEYTDNTTIGELNRKIARLFKWDMVPLITAEDIYYYAGNERYTVNDKRALLVFLMDSYLDRQHTGILHVSVLVCADAGSIDKDGELRYYMYSNETGHNLPHVHVETLSHDYKASISLKDGELLAGSLPPKLLKKARNRINEKIGYFEECWATKTNGLVPDINHHFDFINY